MALGAERVEILDRLVAKGASDALVNLVDGLMDEIQLAARQWLLDEQGGGGAPAEHRRTQLPQQLPPAEERPAAKPPSAPMASSMTSIEVAGLLGVSDSRVRQLAQSGRLLAHHAGRDWAIDRASVEAEVQRRRTTGDHRA